MRESWRPARFASASPVSERLRTKMELPMISISRRIAPVLCCAALCLGASQAEAGVIPWMYNAVFGYGPVFGGSHAAYPGWGGYGYGMGYSMTYPAGPAYGPGYIAPSSPCGPGGCGTSTLNYAPNLCDTCNPCVCDPCDPCSPCGTGACGTGVNVPPPSAVDSQPVPTPSPDQPSKSDDFGPSRLENRDVQPSPEESNAPPFGFEKPMTPAPGDPSEPAPMQPEGAETNPMDAGDVKLEPLTIEVPVSSTLEPVRRRTGLTIGYRVPTVVRVAISPSLPKAVVAPQLAGN